MTVVEQNRINFTMTYATHPAFRRDLDRLMSAAAVGKESTSLMRDGWGSASAVVVSSDASLQVR